MFVKGKDSKRYGVLGVPNTCEVFSFTKINSSYKVKNIYIGNKHCYLITNNNDIYFWGTSLKGENGSIQFSKYISPKMINFSFKKITKIICINNISFILDNKIVYYYGDFGTAYKINTTYFEDRCIKE